MRRLARMADIGLSIAEKLERQAELAAVYAEVDAVPDNLPHSKRLDDIGRTFAQVSRAVSLATALEDRIDKGLPALPDDDRPVREREAREKRAEVARAVVDAIDIDPTVHSRRRVVQLRLNLDRLLDAELADLDRFLRRPFAEIEARLRRDLGLEVDDEIPSPLAGEGQAAMPDLGDSRGEAHGGGCGVGSRWSGAAPPLHPSTSASQDAAEPSIPCRDQSLPVRTARGRAPWARREAAGQRPDLDQSEPASRLACMGSRTVRGQAP